MALKFAAIIAVLALMALVVNWARKIDWKGHARGTPDRIKGEVKANTKNYKIGLMLAAISIISFAIAGQFDPSQKSGVQAFEEIIGAFTGLGALFYFGAGVFGLLHSAVAIPGPPSPVDEVLNQKAFGDARASDEGEVHKALAGEAPDQTIREFEE
jgi:hypothetical protein